MDTISPLGIGKKYQRVVILTGAGVSVASGLPTYRGPGGLWENEALAQIVSAESIPTRLPELWQLYSERRKTALAVGPNAAHRAIAEAQKRCPGQVTLITQNIDNLHQRAGSDSVIELHGSGFRSRCTECNTPAFFDETCYDTLPKCSQCNAPLRPDVVLFGEMLDPEVLWKTKKALRDCDLFLSIGTSGAVYPAARFVQTAYLAEAHCVQINLEHVPSNGYFHRTIIGKAEELLPVLFG
jgi:NAD-dependent deacetylase